MDFSFGEFDSILTTIEFILSSFSNILDYFFFSPSDFLALIGINVTLPSWIGDLTPMSLMLGIGLPFYLAAQFVSWFIRSIKAS